MSNRRVGGYWSLMSNQEFNKGDKVTWQSHGSTAEGTGEKSPGTRVIAY